MKKYFTIEELSRSEIAEERGLDNTPSPEAVENLRKLIDNLLQPLREEYGRPIKVNSGYRSKEVNVLADGAKNSDHLYGYAADITGGSVEANKKIWSIFTSKKLNYKQIIWEKGGTWIHVSYQEGNNKMEVLSSKGKKYIKINPASIYCK